MKLASIISSCVTLISHQVLISLLHDRVGGCQLSGHTLWILIFAVGIDKLRVILICVVVIFLFNTLPALFAYE